MATTTNPTATGSAPETTQEAKVVLGEALDGGRGEVAITLEDLRRHAAILGSTGSGKSHLAMSIVEQVLLLHVPVIVIDRKGDLTTYARRDAFIHEQSNADIEQQRHLLRERVDVALWTPGLSGHHNLFLGLMPADIGALPEDEYEQAVKQSAHAMAEMLGFRNTATHQRYKVILAKALEILGRREREITFDELLVCLNSEDLKRKTDLAPKLHKGLGEEVKVLRLQSPKTLFGNGTRLQIETLLGRGAHAITNRTRLSIINTQFLATESDKLFWISQFASELWRWTVSNPSRQCQAIVLFDEADRYLPASSKPITKEPIEDLLRRGRSAGLGVILSSQNPGDFDYRCRENLDSWFVGLVKDQTTINKVKPQLADTGVAITAHLTRLSPGQFVSRAGTFKARRSVVSLNQMPKDETRELAASKPTAKDASPRPEALPPTSLGRLFCLNCRSAYSHETNCPKCDRQNYQNVSRARPKLCKTCMLSEEEQSRKCGRCGGSLTRSSEVY